MNFLSHAFRFLDQPEFALGTQIPDIMNVVDRKARPRRKLAEPLIDSDDPFMKNLAMGVVQHHIDDHDFHGNVLFHQLNTKLSMAFRALCPDEKGMRSWFTAHIVIEMLLDWAIAGWKPSLRERLYELFSTADVSKVESSVEQIVKKPLPKFQKMMAMFVSERFLFDYDSDEGLLFRINQVVKRVGLDPFDQHGLECMKIARTTVEENWKELLDGLSNPPVDWAG